MNPTALGSGREFDRIRRIWERLGDVAGPLGDDAAVVSVDGARLAITSDLSIEDIHFRRGWTGWREIGWRATAAAISDIAAMAARPMGVLVSLGVNPEWPEEDSAELMAGAGDAAAGVGAAIWGGDIVRAERAVIDVCVVGRCGSRVLERSGAEPGDRLWVTGRLGGPGAALRSWMRREEPEETARARFEHPVPRIEEAQWLLEHGATAGIDLSDGIVSDAPHLAAASGVALRIEIDRVPVHPAADTELAVSGGEEYELMVTLPAGFDESLAEEFRRRFELDLTPIGEAVSGAGVSYSSLGATVEAPRPFEHFL